MRRIINGTLVHVLTIEGDQIYIGIDEAKRILRITEECFPTIYLSGDEEVTLTLDNIDQFELPVNASCYFKGTIEEFTEEPDLSVMLYELELRCINNIKEKLYNIGRPVSGTEIAGAARISENGQHTIIKNLFLNADGELIIENEDGEYDHYLGRVMGGYILPQNSLSILKELTALT